MQPIAALLANVPRAAQRAVPVNAAPRAVHFHAAPRAMPGPGAQALAPALAPALAWALATGAPVAARSRALALRDGVLRVELEAGESGQTLRRHLESVAGELHTALNAMLGPNAVQRLEFVAPISHA